MFLRMLIIVVAEFCVGQSVYVTGRVCVQILGDARGMLGRIRGAQGTRAIGVERTERERHGLRGHAGQQPLAR